MQATGKSVQPAGHGTEVAAGHTVPGSEQAAGAYGRRSTSKHAPSYSVFRSDMTAGQPSALQAKFVISAFMHSCTARCTIGTIPLKHGASSCIVPRGTVSQVLQVVHWPSATSSAQLPDNPPRAAFVIKPAFAQLSDCPSRNLVVWHSSWQDTASQVLSQTPAI